MAHQQRLGRGRKVDGRCHGHHHESRCHSGFMLKLHVRKEQSGRPATPPFMTACAAVGSIWGSMGASPYFDVASF